MPLITSLVPEADPSLEILRDGEVWPDGRCVMLWVSRAKRATANRTANLAITIADRLQLPVVAVFALVPGYPSATLRSYHFMAEGLRELPAGFGRRGIGWVLRIGEPAEVIPALAAELDAAAVVTDQDPLRLGRRWRTDVSARLRIPLIAVDTDTVAPPALFLKEEWGAYTFRRKLWRAIDDGDYLEPIPDPVARVQFDPSSFGTSPDPIAALASLDLDRSVGPAPALRGGPAAARDRLDRFVSERLTTYHTERDRPDREGQSGLGPYLHFGQIGPHEVARAVIDAKAAALLPVGPASTATHASEPGAPDAGPDAFLDELVTQRELAVNFALRNPTYDGYGGLPDWGRKTLEEHRHDRRPVLYDRARLEAAETADALWNAAQRQMVAEGTMPNRLRMYWAKQMLRWTSSPEEAFEITIGLNDRYFLCGRDAAGYANVAWAIGGRHDRPFPPNKPIFGLVRPMGMGAMRRRFDPEAYIALIEERLGPAPRPTGPVQASLDIS